MKFPRRTSGKGGVRPGYSSSSES